MTGTIDDLYFEWLYGLVGAVRNRNPARSYWKLLRQLHSKEFVWFVPNDDNRVEDGRELRHEFLHRKGFDGDLDPMWLELGCSVLEMLIALSRRASFESEAASSEWFWQLLKNIDIHQYSDANYDSRAANRVDDILNRVIYRSYTPSGKGGLFPLRSTTTDQRKVELWYQMSAYLLEGG